VRFDTGVSRLECPDDAFDRFDGRVPDQPGFGLRDDFQSDVDDRLSNVLPHNAWSNLHAEASVFELAGQNVLAARRSRVVDSDHFAAVIVGTARQGSSSS
jgi:hypothetical protein